MRNESGKGRLAPATQGAEGDRISRVATPFDHAHHCRDVHFVRVEVAHHRIAVERSIEDSVIVEIPLIADVLVRRTQGRGQPHVDEVPALALFVCGRERIKCCRCFRPPAVDC